MEAAHAETIDLPWASAVDEAWRVAIDPGRKDGRLVAESAEREVEANEVPLPAQLHPELRAALERSGIRTLYAHQLEALRAVENEDIVITSATAPSTTVPSTSAVIVKNSSRLATSRAADVATIRTLATCRLRINSA